MLLRGQALHDAPLELGKNREIGSSPAERGFIA
jgi:hypothetical protein